MKIHRRDVLIVLMAGLSAAAVFCAYKAFVTFPDPESKEKELQRELSNHDPALAQQFAQIQDQREKRAFMATANYYRTYLS